MKVPITRTKDCVEKRIEQAESTDHKDKKSKDNQVIYIRSAINL